MDLVNSTEKKDKIYLIKEKKQQFLKWLFPIIIKKCSSLLKKINTKEIINPHNYEDFAPKVLEDKDDKYSATIKYAVDNPNIKNLALTGSYGSGKSTLLRTFEHKYKYEYNYLNVSLSTFDDQKIESEKIEYSILKQIFYSVEFDKVPESRFKRIVNYKGIIWKTLLAFLWLVSVFYILDLSILTKIIKILNLDFYWSGVNTIYSLYSLIGTFYLLHKILKFVFNFKLTKLKFQDAELENDQEKKSINFENEIDEILYFFERNPVDIVFFEDLDRLKNTSIFIKLREINNLVNNYEPIKKRNKVTFIYAVQDDIFKESERAKFFDFIVPVIPVINYSNAQKELLEKLKIDIDSRNLTKDFINDVSRYVPDYRTLIAIKNEYSLYKNIINKDLDYNKLLAMMIYKNVEPTDFDRLNCRKGYVYELFKRKDSLISNRLKEIDEEIKQIDNKVQEANNLQTSSIRELRMIYVSRFVEFALTERKKSFSGFNLNNLKIGIKELIDDDSSFESFIKQTNIVYYYDQYYTESSTLSFNRLEQLVNLKLGYLQRLQIIENAKISNLNKLKSTIESLEKEKLIKSSLKLQLLLNKDNSIKYFKDCLNNIFSDDKDVISNEPTKENYLKNTDLLEFLIKSGYIDEEYEHYISYFYAGSISTEDNNFLLSFTNDKPLGFTHTLKELKYLLPEIKEINYSHESILNFSLLDYLFEKNKTHEIKLIVRQLSNGSERALKFIDQYLDITNDQNRSNFIIQLCNEWDKFWNFLVLKSDFSNEKLNTYLSHIFENLSLNGIKRLDQDSQISNYLSYVEDFSFLKNETTVVTKFNNFLTTSSVLFERLNGDNFREIYDIIYKHNLYDINPEMIKLFIILNNKNQIDIDKLDSENFSTIQESGCEKMIDYLNSNIEDYVVNVFLQIEANTQESEKIILQLLKEELSQELKKEIVKKSANNITNITDVTDNELWQHIIENDKIKVSWNNIIEYYNHAKQFDESIINHLNKTDVYLTLSLENINFHDKQIESQFISDLIQSSISDISYSAVTKNLISYDDANEFNSISKDKMSILVQNNIINNTPINYSMIRSEYPSLAVNLIENDFLSFQTKLDEYSLDTTVITKIIESSIITTKQKLDLIEPLTEIIISNDNLSESVCHFLSINEPIDLRNILIHKLLQTKSEADKIRLFNRYSPDYNKDELKELITIIGLPYSDLLLGKYPKVLNNDYNREFVNKLQGILISKPKYIDDDKIIEIIPMRNQ